MKSLKLSIRWVICYEFEERRRFRTKKILGRAQSVKRESRTSLSGSLLEVFAMGIRGALPQMDKVRKFAFVLSPILQVRLITLLVSLQVMDVQRTWRLQLSSDLTRNSTTIKKIRS
ncbi:PREDICTED: uncharacterized protein LOC104788081 isoform X8 [Camelina sativa]|nr:PREDICTED: uncharacterized protein LOC104788081 isoform X8 [Camelina sativa]XP_019101660.1 PREDICTED: uncharacterized protein LOC104788081 isoform X8 [Camelina sativa]XP_019101661.1 PREDICTED: uncharacterized protein LOC104788081 isoform X8 [Camelina sativa]